MIYDALQRLDAYCSQFQYRGWDLFDGLNSRLFKKSPFYRIKAFRLAWIQSFKRSPINLRALMRVPKGENPKGLSLFAAGLTVQNRLEEAKILLDKLSAKQCCGFEGAAWGYNFYPCQLGSHQSRPVSSPPPAHESLTVATPPEGPSG